MPALLTCLLHTHVHSTYMFTHEFTPHTCPLHTCLFYTHVHSTYMSIPHTCPLHTCSLSTSHTCVLHTPVHSTHMSSPVLPYTLEVLGKGIRQERLIAQFGMKEELPVFVDHTDLYPGKEGKAGQDKQPVLKCSSFPAHQSLYTLAAETTFNYATDSICSIRTINKYLIRNLTT